MAAADTAVTLLTGTLILVAGVLLQYRFGVWSQVQRFLRKAVNAETHYKVEAVFSGDIDRDSLHEELKSLLRERYGDIDVLNEDGGLTLEVDETFTVFLEHGDSIVVRTSKMTATMRLMRDEIHDTLSTLHALRTRIQKQVDDATAFSEDQLSATLYLPYRGTLTAFHPRDGLRLKHFSATYTDDKAGTAVIETDDGIEVRTNTLEQLDQVLNRLV